MSVYLVTGTAGFIGAKVAEQLLEGGHEVIGVDNLNDAYDSRLKAHRLARITSPRFQFYRTDIEDAAAMARIFAGREFATVFHLAARPGVRASVQHPIECISANVTGTVNILEAMHATGMRRLVLASTSSLYAGGATPFTEDQPVNTPRSPYAASKKAAEALAHAWHHLHGINVAVLRYFTVFGPAGRPDMSVLRFVRAIAEGDEISVTGNGSQTRDWTYVDDIARGTLAAARALENGISAEDHGVPDSARKPFGFEVINLGGGCRPPVALNEVIAFLENEIGRTARRRHVPADPADMPETAADITKAARLLGWAPQVLWQEGLRRTVAWYRENAEWLRDLRF